MCPLIKWGIRLELWKESKRRGSWKTMERKWKKFLVLERIKKDEVVSGQGLKVKGCFYAQSFRKQIEQWKVKGRKNYFLF